MVGAILVALVILGLGFWMGEPSEEPGMKARPSSPEARAAARPSNAPAPQPPPGSGEQARPSNAEGMLEVEVLSGNTPVPGVQMRLYAREPADLQAFPARWSGGSQGETGAEGRWAVAVAPGSYYVTARVQGRAPGYAAVVHPPGPVRTQVQVRLEQGVEAFGLVLEKATHEPISLAEVIFTPPAFSSGTQGLMDAPEDEQLVATTLETGGFRLPYLAPGRYRIEARAPGYVTAVLPSAPIPFGGRITLMLKPSGQLEGVVLRTDGQPVAGVEVLAVSPQHESTVRTDDAGQFFFELPPGIYTVLARGGEGAGVLKGVAVTVGQRVQGLSVRLSAGSRITGKVVRKDGSPILGARVEACLRELCESRPQQTQPFAGTDESGAFSLSPLAAGSYALKVFLPGGGRLRERLLTLAAGEHSTQTILCEPDDHLECQLREPTSIQGRVLHSRGLPVRNVFVNILSAEPARNAIRYDRDEFWSSVLKRKPTGYEFVGDRFELHGLSPGPQMLMVRSDGMSASLLLDLRPGERRVLELTVYPPVSMRVRLMDAATHQPLSWGLLRHPVLGLAESREKERFVFHALPPGEQILHVIRDVPGTRQLAKTSHTVRLTTNPENDLGDLEVPAP